LDTVVVIYAVEGPSPFKARAKARLASLRQAGECLVVSDLTHLECHIKPIRLHDSSLAAEFDLFFAAPDLLRFSMPTPVFDRAADIRANHAYKLADALHLAVAMEGGCDLFLTNDHRLGGFPALTVEVLS
ncbi:MAG: type II toxin-antitoxin system VapC family toxin, partial [Isosphaeraceae bacterium]